MNYFTEQTNIVEDLQHFPYSDFNEFKIAVKEGEILDCGIAMDYARKWITGSSDAPSGWRNFSNLLMLFPYLLIIFYFVLAFWIKNYWLIPYSIVPVIFTFFANPMGRKAFKIHYYFIAIYVIAALFIKDLWSLMYWFPLVLIYLSLNQLYEGSAQIVRENLVKNEKLLCLFWKWWDMVIYLKDGTKLSQRYREKNGNTDYYEDIDKDWEEYVNQNIGSSKTTQQNLTKEVDPLINKAVDIIIRNEYESVSPSLFQRRLAINYDRAEKIIVVLIENGILDKSEKDAPNKVLILDSSRLNKIKEVFTSLPKYSIEEFENEEDIKLTDRDSIYPEVKEYIKSQKKISVEILQNNFDIGYARAARIMDHLNEDGLLELEEKKPTDSKIKTQFSQHAILIEKTLQAFGITTRIVDLIEYKEYVKYCLEITLGTSIDDISNHAKDIALAVASPSGKVTIEGPIPGRALVGVIIPKHKTSEINLDSKPVKIYSELVV